MSNKNFNFKALQNGSDVRGIAFSPKNNFFGELSPQVVSSIAVAFANFVRYKFNINSPRIAVGHDTRLTGEVLANATLFGIQNTGAIPLYCGTTTTPAMFMSTVFEKTQCDASIMITASHMPPDRNGMKFFVQKTLLSSNDLSEILHSAILDTYEPSMQNFEFLDIMTPYVQHLKNVICSRLNSSAEQQPLTGCKICVNAGGGAGGFFAHKVLAPLGADISSSVLLEPDGHFSVHIPNPESNDAISYTQKAVLTSGADLGLIFDTDVDRAGAIFSDGTTIAKNSLIALVASIISDENLPQTIVTDSVTSNHLTDFLLELGIEHHRFRRGYKNVIDECIRLNLEGVNSPVAIETSGHCAFRDNYFLDDGAYLSALIVVELCKKRQFSLQLNDNIATLRHSLESAELKLRVTQYSAKEIGLELFPQLLENFRNMDGAEIVTPNFEGIRVNIENGWFLLRCSLHDPYLVLNVESDNNGGVQKILKTLAPLLIHKNLQPLLC